MVVVSQVLYAITCMAIVFVTDFNVILALRFILGSLATPTFYMLGEREREIEGTIERNREK